MISGIDLVVLLNGYSPVLLKAAYYLSQSLYVLAVLVVLLAIKKNGLAGGIYRASVLAIVYVINFELKMIFNIPRPNDVRITFIETENDNSFPSMHASGSFGAAAISGEKLLYLWALLISVSRIILGVHYLKDVIAGALLGYAIGKLAARYEKQAIKTFFSGEHTFETGRKLFHGFFGVLVAAFAYLAPKEIAAWFLLASIAISFVISRAIKRRVRLPFIEWVIRTFERKKDIENFPLKGTIYFLIGALISVLVYRTDIAATSIIILALGDCFSTLIGKPLGMTRHAHNAKKSIEGSFAGFVAAVAGAALFIPAKLAFIGALAGIIVESFDFMFMGLDIDDNLSIPVISGGVMTAAVLLGI